MRPTTITSPTSNDYIPPISIPGIGMNIDISTLIMKLIQAESKGMTLRQTWQKAFQTQLSAVGSLRSTPSTFQTTMATLNNPDTFTGSKADGHDTSILTASLSNTAPAGTYRVSVIQLARAQVLSAAEQTSSKTPIGGGTPTTFTFSFGSVSDGSFANGKYTDATFMQNGNQTDSSITIDPLNNTFAGIRDAINNANVGISAGIVNDGSDSPYRLVLTSTTGGANSEMKIVVSGDSALQSLLSHDPADTQNMTGVTIDHNAFVTVNGINMQSATNTLTDVVDGTSFTLTKTNSTNTTVGNDASQASQSALNFAKAYDALRIQLSALTKLDTTSAADNGTLAGGVSTKAMVNQLTNVLDQGIGNGTLQPLNSIDVAIDKEGTLSIDGPKLSAALKRSPSQMAALFAGTGTAADLLLKVASFSTMTQAGSYAVSITQLATQGSLKGSAAVNTTTQSGVNNSLSVMLSGIATNIRVPASSYTASNLVTQIQSRANASPGLQRAKVEVVIDADTNSALTLADKQYGSVSTVSVSRNGTTSLLGGNPTTTVGHDAQGTINGAAITGSGQNLQGASGSVVDGLTVQVTGGTLDDRGTITVQHGYMVLLHTVSGNLLSNNGMVQDVSDATNNSITPPSKEIDLMWKQLGAKQTLYYTQLNALSEMMANMTNTSTYLTTQLAILQKQRTEG